MTRCTQLEHPALQQYGRPSRVTRVDLPVPECGRTNYQPIVPANPYLTEEIPHWLFIYSKAPTELDHKLKVGVMYHAHF